MRAVTRQRRGADAERRCADRRERRARRVARWRAGLRRSSRVAADYAVIVLGSILIAVGANLFMIPNRVVSGGVTGVGTILYYLMGLPVGMVTLAINVPLFVIALKWGGGISAGVRTVVAVTVMTLAIDLLPPYLPEHVTSDPLLYTLYGGLLDGLGLGLVFRAGGTTGGTDILAQLLDRAFGWKIGHTLLAANVLILGSSALIFGLEPALYALLLAIVSSRVIDLVQEGIKPSRAAWIITKRSEAVRMAILQDMERGVTVFQGEGGYTGEPKRVLLCAVSQSELSRLERLVSRIDPEAFMIVQSASEVIGEGFRGFSAP